MNHYIIYAVLGTEHLFCIDCAHSNHERRCMKTSYHTDLGPVRPLFRILRLIMIRLNLLHLHAKIASEELPKYCLRLGASLTCKRW